MESVTCLHCRLSFPYDPAEPAASCPFCRCDPFERGASRPTLRPGIALGVAAVSLGVFGLCFLAAGFAYKLPVLVLALALPCGILAIVFGVAGRQTEGRGMARAGAITGAVAITALIVGEAVNIGLAIRAERLAARQRAEDRSELEKKKLGEPFEDGR